MTTAYANDPMNILFLCTGNSARSIMAECIMNREGAGKFNAFSAGSMPTGKVNPYALNLLQKLNYVTTDLRSKFWEEFSEPRRTKARFRFHGLRQRSKRSLPDLAWPAHVRPLGRAGPSCGRGH